MLESWLSLVQEITIPIFLVILTKQIKWIMELLTQVPRADFAFKNGSYADQCNCCIPQNLSNREFTEMLKNQCGST